VLREVLQSPAELIWHERADLSNFDCIVLPGGFAHGDYLRAGAIARFSPVMDAVARFAEQGGLVWGICNGFQVLVEAGLLPGAMIQNAGLRFVCRWVNVRVESQRTPLTADLKLGTVLRLPIAHHEGSYFADPATLAGMERNGQIILRYCTPEGDVASSANPNGSVSNIAGVCNLTGNVFGLMPHPERCAEAILGGVDGLRLFRSLVDNVPAGITASGEALAAH
jgi:phosphoribosylformylglycinamidine synthase